MRRTALFRADKDSEARVRSSSSLSRMRRLLEITKVGVLLATVTATMRIDGSVLKAGVLFSLDRLDLPAVDTYVLSFTGGITGATDGPVGEADGGLPARGPRKLLEK